MTVQAATVSDYNNFNATWSLDGQIANHPNFVDNAYSTAKTTIRRNNGTVVNVTAVVTPLEGKEEGATFLIDGANQASYKAIASQFANNPDPATLPALGIFTLSPKSTATSLEDIKAKLNYNGSIDVSTITYTFSEPVTNPVIDLSGIGGFSESTGRYGGSRGSFNNTIIELINSDAPAIFNALTTTNLTVSDRIIKVTDRNTYFRSVLDENYNNPGTEFQSPKFAPAGTGTVQIRGTVKSVTFKLSHDAVPYSTFAKDEYGTGSAYFDSVYDKDTLGAYTDGINGANKFWEDFQKYGFKTTFSNDDLFRMSLRLPDVGDVTVEHQIIDANGNVIGTLEEKSSVKTNETVGVAYTTTPLEGDKLVKDGKTYEYVKVADTSAPTNGEVKTATQHVIYQYREVKGGEVVEKHVIEGTDTELVTADGTPTAATVKEAGSAIDEAFSTQPKSALLYDAQGNAYKSNGDTDGKDNNATGKVTADKQTVTFEYVPVKGSVTVNYVDEAGNPILGVDPKTVKDNEPVTKDGNKYDTTTEDFRPKTVTATDGTEYELVAETPKDGSADPTGTVEEGTKNVTYVYRKVVKGGEVVEKHVIEGTDTELVTADGTPTAATVKEAGTPLDEAFSTQPKSDLLYDAQGNAYKSNGDTDGKDNNATGKVTADKQTVTFEYVPVKGSVTVDYVDEDGNPIPGVDPKTVKDNEPVTKDGNKYDTTTEDFRPKKVTATDGTEYELVAETPKDGSADPTGTVEEGTKNVTYVYRKVVKTGSVVARYVIEGTETEIADDKSVKPTDTPVDEVYGDTPPTTIEKDGKTYELVRTRTNEGDAPSNGTVVEGEQTITYEYKEKVETPVVKTGSVVARYVIEGTETEIADDKTVKPADTPVDEVYGDTPPATITKDGKTYELVRTRTNEGDAPSNGTVVEGEQTITYEYKEVVETPKTGNVVITYVDTEGVELKTTVKDTIDGVVGSTYNTKESADEYPETIEKDGVTYKRVVAGTHKVGDTTADGHLVSSAAAEGTVEEGTKTVTYVYEKVETPVVKTGSVVARYVIEGTETEIADDKTVKPTDTPVDEPYGDTPPTTISFGGKTYTLVRTRTNEGDAPSNGTVVEGEQTITYEYKEVVDTPDPVEKKTGSVLVRHITDKGEVLADTTDVVRDGEVGSTYETTVGNFEGYTFVKVDETGATPTGEVEEGEKTVVYIYTKVETPVVKTGSVVARYVIEGTEDEIADDKSVKPTDTPVDEPYGDTPPATITKDGKTYELVRTRTNEGDAPSNGTVVEGEQTITYEYKEKVETPVVPPVVEKQGKVIVHYVDEKGNVIKTPVVDTENGTVGGDYDTSDNRPKVIVFNGKRYILVESRIPNNSRGKVVEGETHVTYVYKQENEEPTTPNQPTTPSTTPVTETAKVTPKTSAILPETGESTSALALVGLALLGTVAVASRRRKEK